MSLNPNTINKRITQNKYLSYFSANTSDKYSQHVFVEKWEKISNYSRTSMARTSLGSWKLVRGMGSSSHSGLIMAPSQKQMAIILGNLFYLLHNNCILSVLIRIASMRRF